MSSLSTKKTKPGGTTSTVKKDEDSKNVKNISYISMALAIIAIIVAIIVVFIVIFTGGERGPEGPRGPAGVCECDPQSYSSVVEINIADAISDGIEFISGQLLIITDNTSNGRVIRMSIPDNFDGKSGDTITIYNNSNFIINVRSEDLAVLEPLNPDLVTVQDELGQVAANSGLNFTIFFNEFSQKWISVPQYNSFWITLP